MAGLNVLSELAIRRASWDGSDLAATIQHIGYRGGVLVPEPLIVVSRRFYEMIADERLRGAKVEVAYLI